MTHPGYNHRNLAVVWNKASSSSDDLSVGAVARFLNLDPYEKNKVVARWEDSLDKFTRSDLRDIDERLAELAGKLDGEFETELLSARRLVFDLYFVADEDGSEFFDNWDGRTPPALLWDLVE